MATGYTTQPPATTLQNLQQIAANLIQELANETARRANLTAAGQPPPVTYSINGRQVDWSGYLREMKGQIEAYRALAQTEDLFENHEHGYT